MTTDVKQSPSRPTVFGTIVGIILVVALAYLSHWVKVKVYGVPNVIFGIPGKALEYPLWAALIGLVANFLLRMFKVHDRLVSGFRTELFLKVGLVLLGATISFKTIATAAGGAILQAIILILAVYLFTWWLGGKFGLSDSLRAIMASALSICGVSAAIAAAGAVQARKQEITYITALVILVALPMMVLMPILAHWMGLSEAVAGAWFGGNVDTTAAVVGAGKIYGGQAETIASIVKSTQNAFIGVVAFLLALYFTTVVEGKKNERPSAAVIWQRFPKFVLGFIVASVVFSLGWIPAAAKAAPLNAGNAIVAIKDWAFCLAFVSMGLTISFSDLKQMGWKPAVVYLVATVFNTLLALVAAWLIFGLLFPA